MGGISEIGLGIGITLLAATGFYVAESVFNMSFALKSRFLPLLENTVTSENKQLIIHQDASKYSNAKQILLSDNERTGIEFSYSYYLLVDEKTFQGEDKLHNVFYKGYNGHPWPLQAPGVYILGNTNTMRIIFNNYQQVYNYLDIENIPVGKWFHVVLNFQNLALEVHINGRLVKKLQFKDTLPYMNYEDIIIFSNATATVNIPNQQAIRFDGSIVGQISNLIYTRYALSYNEIQKNYSAGPSKVVQTTATAETPPYFADSWYTNQ